MRPLLLGLLLLGVIVLVGCASEPKPPTFKVTPQARVVFWGGETFGIYAICDKSSNLIYYTDRGSIAVVADGCSGGIP